MSTLEIIVLAFALSADAFAVAVCKGLSIGKASFKVCLWTGLWFGTFQAIMPTVGYFCARLFSSFTGAYSCIISSGILLFLGINMIKNTFSEDAERNTDVSVKEMLLLSTATSIDALSAGISFAMTEGAGVFMTVFLIGIITFSLSTAGVKIGGIAGTKYNGISTVTGGVILIILAVKGVVENYLVL